MSEIQLEEWEQIQTNIDTCDRCKSETLFDTKSIIPARPWNPMHRGRLLFISENPPITGGFWETKSEDGLRQNLLRLLNIPSSSDHNEALKSFLAHRYSGDLQFFLIQTLKWPYAKVLREQKRGYNQNRSPTMRRLIEHTVSAHLGPEIAAILPIGTLATAMLLGMHAEHYQKTIPNYRPEELRQFVGILIRFSLHQDRLP